jgi:hypothetical protein
MDEDAHLVTPLALSIVNLADAIVGGPDSPDAMAAFLMGAEIALVLGRDFPDVAARVLASLAEGDPLPVTVQRDRTVASFAYHIRHHT